MFGSTLMAVMSPVGAEVTAMHWIGKDREEFRVPTYV
jgi:hypothetical protein